MGFKEKEISGTVLLPAREEQLSPRELDYGSRSVPVTHIRIEDSTGKIWSVNYVGEMDGQVSQGDFLVVEGFERGPNNFQATSVWLKGQLDSQGRQIAVDPPVRLAHKCVCAVATCLFGRDSEEVGSLVQFRDRNLAYHTAGRAVIWAYYSFAPWFTIRILENSPGLRRALRVVVHHLVRCIDSKPRSQ